MPESIPLPPGFAVDAPAVPATPKDAATVMLVRDGASSLEVFLQHRVAGMAFAGGMTVFPGGGVDPRDADGTVAWAGPDAEYWAKAFGCTTSLARALVCAAVRETFEECGVLLAGPSGTTVVEDAGPFHDARGRLASRELSLAEFLDAAGLVLRADLLRPWSSWVTPAQEPRRYDTRFFLAGMPAGQRADGATSEAEASGWYRPSDVLADVHAGRTMMMPPTAVTIGELAAFDTVADALAAERDVARFAPAIVADDRGARLEFTEES
jgi:8-oxo-dGTP pyrophosphatase MutT (NUDIX family)